MATHQQKKTEEKESKPVFVGKASSVAYASLLEPWITEKSHASAATGKYIFKVHGSANKQTVRRAIKDLYQVTVVGVNMVTIHPKKRVYGRSTGWKAGFKKAIVTLKEGDKIELFEGV